MNFLNAQDDYFFYGETCKEFDKEPLQEFARTAQRKKFKISLPKGTSQYARVDTSRVLLVCGTQIAARTPRIKNRFEEDWGKKLKWIDDFLDLGQERIASVLNISTSTVQKIMTGKTKEPYVETKERIRRFSLIVEFVNEKTNGKKFQARALFFNPLTALGNQSAVDYLVSSKDKYSLNDIDGLMRRILE